jgi:hypothetical protein
MRERNTETLPCRTTTGLLALCLLLPLAWVGIAQAQPAADSRAETPRMLALVSGGASLRLTLDSDLGQERLGPVFGDVLLGYMLPGGRLQHGFGVGVSWNATHDGGYTTPVYAFDQIALMPAYLAYYHFDPDVFGIGHIGLPVLVRGGPSAGLEVSAAIAYRVLAGTGVFAGVALNSHVAHGFSLFASLELGVVIDYEVLP